MHQPCVPHHGDRGSCTSSWLTCVPLLSTDVPCSGSISMPLTSTLRRQSRSCLQNSKKARPRFSAGLRSSWRKPKRTGSTMTRPAMRCPRGFTGQPPPPPPPPSSPPHTEGTFYCLSSLSINAFLRTTPCARSVKHIRTTVEQPS